MKAMAVYLVPLMVFLIMDRLIDTHVFNPAEGGDPHAGEQALLRYGCGGCHTTASIQAFP